MCYGRFRSGWDKDEVEHIIRLARGRPVMGLRIEMPEGGELAMAHEEHLEPHVTDLAQHSLDGLSGMRFLQFDEQVWSFALQRLTRTRNYRCLETFNVDLDMYIFVFI